MSEQTDDELRDELESLRARVSRLERLLEQDDGNPTPTGKTTSAARLDHFDEPVVERLEQHETYHVRELVKRYLAHSRITDDETAKERVQQLVRSDGFENRGGGQHTFTGWER